MERSGLAGMGGLTTCVCILSYDGKGYAWAKLNANDRNRTRGTDIAHSV